MRLDPVLVLDTKAWFRKAAIDLRSADADLKASPPILEDVVFHCQQAAEKAIKGFLTYHQQPFGKTHDLRELAKACLRVDITLAPVLPLTWYAWKFRYPGSPEEPSLEEAQDALGVAGDLGAALLSRLPDEVGS